MQEPTVVSKYFKSKKQMDDSLQDFKETKIKPKEVKKPPAKTVKKQPKRNVKREKGQKDIRSVLKPKKNDLVTYAEEFRKVCIENGVDIDPEQLQIAVALSKSLSDCDSQISTEEKKFEECSSQNRSNKIRSTLQEYGFHIPQVKKTIEVKKRGRKYLKNSKLLITTDEEKRQKIADKVSEILLDCNNVFVSEGTTINTDNVFKLTSHHFNFLKDDTCFYKGDIVEIAPNTVGCLLKDWSKIPGRPASPTPVVLNDQHFTDYIDNQDDLDVILSSTMSVVKRLVDALKREKTIEGPKEGIYAEPIVITREEIPKENVSPLSNLKGNENMTDKVQESTSKETVEIITPSTMRSYSPDLFEDEPSVDDDTNYCATHSESEKNIKDIPPVYDYKIPLSATKITTDDFMDLTTCVNTVKPTDYLPECKIDLTHNDIARNPESDIHARQNIQHETAENVDLTQSSDSSINSLPCVHLSNQDNYEIMTLLRSKSDEYKLDCDEAGPLHNNENHMDSNLDTASHNNDEVDLTQHSSSPELINTNISEKFEVITNNSGLFDDFVYRHSSASENTSKDTEMSIDIEIESVKIVQHESTVKNNDCNIDLTQSPKSTEDIDESLKIIHKYSHNNNPDIDYAINLDSTGDSIKELVDKTVEYNDYNEEIQYNILEQEAMEEDDELNKTSSELMEKFVNKIDISSIPIELDLTETKLNTSEVKLNVLSKESAANDDEPIISQCFEISDDELDYSMQYFKKRKQSTANSRCSNPIPVNDNFNLGGSSILNEIPSNRPSTSYETPTHPAITRIRDQTIDDSLPAVDIKGTKVKIKSLDEITNSPGTPLTPLRKPEGCSLFTPGNTEYIVKTTNVTPMMDYGSLSTPQMHKELDKFGLKPLKRKRAVQLLEHLYFQTHPIVEKTSDNEDSKTKRPKKVYQEQDQDAHSRAKPDEQMQSENISDTLENSLGLGNVVESIDSNENVKIYEADCLDPVLRNIPCDKDDWIFQKREKTKVHSCRVPLHIAFHNYVNARPLLREAILRYEPISIDVIHKQLAKDGHRYDPKDLLKFLDKKCITVKTVSTSKNGGRRSRRS